MPAAASTTSHLLGALVQLALIVLGAIGGVGVIVLLQRWFCGQLTIDRARRRRSSAAHPGVVPMAARRPLAVVASDVRRLAREVALVPSGTAQARRLGLLAAYDDVLIEASLLLEVPHELAVTPIGAGRDLERLRLVAALESAGLVLDS